VIGNLLWPIYNAIEKIFGEPSKKELEASIDILETLELLPHTASKLGFVVDDETKMETLIEGFLMPLF
jgi:hypothetical protein